MPSKPEVKLGMDLKFIVHVRFIQKFHPKVKYGSVFASTVYFVDNFLSLKIKNKPALMFKRYYRCVLTELKKLDLEALVILYYPTRKAPHLGLPGILHASGGWLNYSTVEAFQEYASLCYQELGSLVRYWITVNEPNRLTDIYSDANEQHRVAHNLLLAHAKAWGLHERMSSRQQGAMVSLALHADWAEDGCEVPNK